MLSSQTGGVYECIDGQFDSVAPEIFSVGVCRFCCVGAGVCLRICLPRCIRSLLQVLALLLPVNPCGACADYGDIPSEGQCA